MIIDHCVLSLVCCLQMCQHLEQLTRTIEMTVAPMFQTATASKACSLPLEHCFESKKCSQRAPDVTLSVCKATLMLTLTSGL